jgi:hypothetical protein
VVYFVLEGKPAFPLRVAAAFEDVMGKQMKLGDNPRLPFAWNSYSPSLFTNGPDAMIKLVERDAVQMRLEFSVDLVAVFIDTIGLAALYENEDKSAQVQRVLSGLNRLSEVTGSLVIPVDHMGKDQEAGPRGASAKRDLPETILSCLVDKDANGVRSNFRMAFHKIRDGEEGRIIPYRLAVTEHGMDEDGDTITTCIVQWEPDRPPPEKQRAQPKSLSMLDEAIFDVGGLPADIEKLRTAFYKVHGGDTHAANVAWNRAVKRAMLVMDGSGKLDRPTHPVGAP